jgi:hypothetical protein
MSSATSGIGTKLKRGDGGSPEAFTDVAEVTHLQGPDQALEFVDVTNFDSTNFFREWLPTFKDGGQVQCDVNFLPNTPAQSNLRTDHENRTLRNFRIVWSNAGATQANFAAYVTGYAPDADVAQALKAKITLKISGAVTWV